MNWKDNNIFQQMPVLVRADGKPVAQSSGRMKRAKRVFREQVRLGLIKLEVTSV